MTIETDARPLVDRIVEQRARVVEAQRDRDRYQEAVRVETRHLAELLASTDDDPDPDVTITAAARAIGVTKGYAHALVKRLREGKLDA